MSVYMDPEMQVLIKREAEKGGIGASELVRRAVSLYLGGKEEWRSFLREPEGSLSRDQLGGTLPDSWHEFYERCTWLFLGMAGLMQSWREALIKKSESQTKGAYPSEEVNKDG